MNFLFVHLIVGTMMGWRDDAVATVRKNTKMRRFTFRCILYVAAYHALPFLPTHDIFVPPTQYSAWMFGAVPVTECIYWGENVRGTEMQYLP